MLLGLKAQIIVCFHQTRAKSLAQRHSFLLQHCTALALVRSTREGLDSVRECLSAYCLVSFSLSPSIIVKMCYPFSINVYTSLALLTTVCIQVRSGCQVCGPLFNVCPEGILPPPDPPGGDPHQRWPQPHPRQQCRSQMGSCFHQAWLTQQVCGQSELVSQKLPTLSLAQQKSIWRALTCSAYT